MSRFRVQGGQRRGLGRRRQILQLLRRLYRYVCYGSDGGGHIGTGISWTAENRYDKLSDWRLSVRTSFCRSWTRERHLCLGWVLSVIYDFISFAFLRDDIFPLRVGWWKAACIAYVNLFNHILNVMPSHTEKCKTNFIHHWRLLTHQFPLIIIFW